MQSTALYLFPGMLTDERLWSYLPPLPATSYSMPIDQHDRLPVMAEDWLQQLPEHAVFLCGLSMGGYGALAMTRLLHQQGALHRIKGLILLATSARADTPEQFKTRRGLIQLAEKGRFKGVTPKLLPTLIHPSKLQNTQLTSLIMQMAKDAGQQTFIRQEKAVMHRQSQLDLLPHLDIPTLIITGDHDQRTPPECAQEMHHLLPKSQLHILKECGHLPPLEKPEETHRLIHGFMEDHGRQA